MKFSCTQENLHQGLSVVSHIANKNVNLPILGNVLVRAEDSGLKFMATNLEIAVSCTVRSQVPGRVKVTSVATTPGASISIATSKSASASDGR